MLQCWLKSTVCSCADQQKIGQVWARYTKAAEQDPDLPKVPEWWDESCGWSSRSFYMMTRDELDAQYERLAHRRVEQLVSSV